MYTFSLRGNFTRTRSVAARGLRQLPSQHLLFGSISRFPPKGSEEVTRVWEAIPGRSWRGFPGRVVFVTSAAEVAGLRSRCNRKGRMPPGLGETPRCALRDVPISAEGRSLHKDEVDWGTGGWKTKLILGVSWTCPFRSSPAFTEPASGFSSQSTPLSFFCKHLH